MWKWNLSYPLFPTLWSLKKCIHLCDFFSGFPSWRSWFHCFSTSIPHMVMLVLPAFILHHIYQRHVMEAMHFSSHQATCLQRPVMEYGPMVQHVGGCIWLGASLVLQHHMLVIKTRQFRSRLLIILVKPLQLITKPWFCPRQLLGLLQIHLPLLPISI